MSVRGPTKKTYAAMQFWRFIRPGMRRIGVSVNGILDAVAFEDSASEKTVLVLLNRTKMDLPLSLNLTSNRVATIERVFITDASRNCTELTDWRNPSSLSLPPLSVATLVLKTSLVAH